METYTLVVKVKDHDNWTKNQEMGSVMIDFDDILANGGELVQTYLKVFTDFQNVLKSDPNFPDILNLGSLQFSKCPQSWFFQNSRFILRRKFPMKRESLIR